MTVSGLDQLLLEHTPSKPLSYGTAGFRGHADTLPEAMFRCGVLASLRSLSLNNRPVGVMVTASHNPASDNGLKLVEPDGSMLDVSWEQAATPFVNAKESPLQYLEKLVDLGRGGVVVVGWDTRESAQKLVRLVKEGVEGAGGVVEELGCVTTPQLHYVLRERNMGKKVGVEDYYTEMKKAYDKMVSGKDGKINGVVVDCANGVGAQAVKKIEALVKGCKVVNLPEDGPLNEQCGADYVQKKRALPKLYTDVQPGDCGIWASLDGDADRLVMYKVNGEDVHLADGDRFATLLANFVADLIKKGGIDLTVGVAQTAYSNGAATELLKSIEGVEVVIAKTGVKHLEKAVKKFDVGIYWEPNGHGTVLFGKDGLLKLKTQLEEMKEDQAGSQQKESLEKLMAVSELANQAVGDGVADLLLALGVLAVQDMGFEEWVGMYEERCSWNLVVRLEDKTVIETEDCDRKVKEPLRLKKAVEKAASDEGCRAFVRPSGTEDVVRVYSEAPAGNEARAREMAIEIGRAVYDFCGGVGDRL